MKSSFLVLCILNVCNICKVITLPLLQAKPLKISLILPDVLDSLRSGLKMEEFSKHLGLRKPGLCHPYKEHEEMIPMFNEDLHYGDLLLEDEEYKEYQSFKEVDEEKMKSNGKKKSQKDDGDSENVAHDFESDNDSEPEDEEESGEKSEKTSTTKKRKWPNCEIPYHISSDYKEEEKEQLKSFISDLNSRLTNCQLRPFDSSRDTNYLYIFNGRGCYSRLGMAGGHQALSLQSGKCMKRGIVQHELMHAFGFAHEHNRPDRNSHIKVVYDNIPDKWQNDYKRKNMKNLAYVGQYDYFSAMHYPVDSPGGNGKKAIIILDSTVDPKDVGNKDRLSDYDAKKIETYYSTEENSNSDNEL